MRRLPPLTAVRTFEAAARHQNFTQAAAELGMTQAAVSYQIRLLEERLGMPLFLRSKQRVTLTDAGRKAAPLISNAFDTLDDAFAGLVNDDQGVLSISTTQTFATAWMAARLGSFQIDRPELAVRLHTDARVVDFARDEIDVAIRSRVGKGDWPGLKCHFLFRLHSTPLCSPDFLDRHRIREPADLLSVPRLSADDIWWKQWFAAAGVSVPEAPRSGGVMLDTQVTEANAALAGLGVGMLTPMFWRSELDTGRLVQLFPLTAFEGPGYWLVYPEYKRAQPKIAAFRDWLSREVRVQSATAPAEAFVPPA